MCVFAVSHMAGQDSGRDRRDVTAAPVAVVVVCSFAEDTSGWTTRISNSVLSFIFTFFACKGPNHYLTMAYRRLSTENTMFELRINIRNFKTTGYEHANLMPFFSTIDRSIALPDRSESPFHAAYCY